MLLYIMKEVNMKFEDQVKEAKIQKLQYRIIRDVTFVALGIVFLIISILIEVKKENSKKDNIKNNNTTITTTIKK